MPHQFLVLEYWELNLKIKTKGYIFENQYHPILFPCPSSWGGYIYTTKRGFFSDIFYQNSNRKKTCAGEIVPILATDELLCDKNAGAWVSMVSYLKKMNNN